MLRQKQISLKRVLAAVERGRKVCREWQAKDERWHEWQAEYCELALLPEVWQRIGQKMAEERCAHSFAHYGQLSRLSASGLPGYVLQSWNGPPREGWEYSHSPGCAWDGVRRNLYGSLVELLRQAAYPDVHHSVADDLRNRWNVVLVA